MATSTVPVHLKAALSVSEVTELVGLSDKAIRRLVATGVLRRVPHTSRLLISRAELDRWLHEMEPVAS